MWNKLFAMLVKVDYAVAYNAGSNLESVPRSSAQNFVRRIYLLIQST